jgi:hypothetical protein
MSPGTEPLLETDPLFPSGPWTGFFLMPHTGSRRHPTDLQLTFAGGVMAGTGRDFVGPFTIQGKYNVADGKCSWTKHYLNKHKVFYTGYNEGKGIWGTWDIPNALGLGHPQRPWHCLEGRLPHLARRPGRPVPPGTVRAGRPAHRGR